MSRLMILTDSFCRLFAWLLRKYNWFDLNLKPTSESAVDPGSLGHLLALELAMHNGVTFLGTVSVGKYLPYPLNTKPGGSQVSCGSGRVVGSRSDDLMVHRSCNAVAVVQYPDCRIPYGETMRGSSLRQSLQCSITTATYVLNKSSTLSKRNRTEGDRSILDSMSRSI
jgi:hypothetical protein